MRLLYAARERKQGAVLTGEYGSGKTLLSRVVLQDLGGDSRFETVLIVNPKIAKKELLREVLFQLGIQDTTPQEEEIDLLRRLEGRLHENLDKKKQTIFLVDEAQVMTESELEDMRLLLNFQNKDSFLLTLILIGQVGLKRRIQNIEPLKQRLALRFHLEALTFPEVEHYISHRLKVAGKRGSPFSPGALGMIHEGSRGIPRQINNICDHALLVGFSRKSTEVGVEIIEECLKDLGLQHERAEIIHGTSGRHIEEDPGLPGELGRNAAAIGRTTIS